MDSKRAREYILWLLARRDYSRAQLEKKLQKHRLDKTEGASLLDSLTKEGIFRETAYQKARTRQLLKKGLGASMVKAKLRSEKCKINDDDIALAFEEIGSDANKELRLLIQKHLRRYERGIEKIQIADSKKMLEKITKSLQLKGHRFADISRILKEEMAAKLSP